MSVIGLSGRRVLDSVEQAAPGATSSSVGGVDSPRPWVRAQLVTVALVIMLVPVHRYALSFLPMKAADPFRVVLLSALGLLLAMMAVDPARFRWHSMGAGRVLLGLFGVAIFSDAFNMGFIGSNVLQDVVLNAYYKMLSYAAALVLVRQLVRSLIDAHAVLGALVTGGALASVGAAVERVTNDNVFKHLNDYLPLTVTYAERVAPSREGALRAMGSAEHPIAFAAVLMMLVPVAVYLAARADWPSPGPASRWFYAVCCALMLLGVACTTSRTGVVMAVVATLVALVLRPGAVRRVVPLVLAAGLFINVVVVPGALSSLVDAFDPQGGFLAEQTGAAGTTAGGRLGDLPTVANDIVERPLTGMGFGTRVFLGPHTNALILDNEYLGRLVESGLPGLVAVVLTMLVPLLLVWRIASRRDGSASDLCAALACGFAAFACSMATFDALSFTQVAMVYFMLVGVAVAVSATAPAQGRSPGAV
jgi:O-antigen ligase